MIIFEERVPLDLRNDPQFYELCDELGLYVVDEANIESHGVDFAWSKTLGNKAGAGHVAAGSMQHATGVCNTVTVYYIFALRPLRICRK